MDTATINRPTLSTERARALANRQRAAMIAVKDAKTPEERWSLLTAVVCPMTPDGEFDPLLGLDWPTSSATESS